jgi:hypothetical protein
MELVLPPAGECFFVCAHACECMHVCIIGDTITVELVLPPAGVSFLCVCVCVCVCVHVAVGARHCACVYMHI